MKCLFKINLNFSKNFNILFLEFIFLLLDYYLDKANSLIIPKKCWNQIETENFFEKVFFAICYKIFLVFSIALYLIYLQNSKNDNNKKFFLNRTEKKKNKKLTITKYFFLTT